ncbi:hypothetical protein BJ322DRAFT_1021824 [Thelephora terrestris]|uniref:DUF6532 domain-containing protein n=1 Tax=Thelephora terrestris TaxID=56493 RepID=A0A9P6HCG9_9AGAM|nr:hypothetical protein BJ322DRAFT_1021824 [Thelephora terrestris]
MNWMHASPERGSEICHSPKESKRRCPAAKEYLSNHSLVQRRPNTATDWVETGRRKDQAQVTQITQKTPTTRQPKDSRTKAVNLKDSRVKGRGGKRLPEDDTDEVKQVDEPRAKEFGPVAVGSGDSSSPEDEGEDGNQDEDEDERVAEFGSRRSRSAVSNPSKRKRANTASIEREDVEQDLGLDVGVHRNASRAAAPALRKPSVPLGSRGSQLTRTQTLKVKHQPQKTQQRKTSSGQRTLESDPNESSNGVSVEFENPEASNEEDKEGPPERCTRAFIDDGEDEEKPKKLAEKTVSANGRKPKIVMSDPIFELIWRQANKELKRSVFFIDPFPDSESYEALPMEVYATATRFVGKMGCYQREEVRRQAQEEYNAEWSTSLTHKLSVLRAQLKSATVDLVRESFKDLGHSRRKKLLDEDEYWFKLSVNGEPIQTAPFMHPILQLILRKGLFDGRSGLYKVFPEEFKGELNKKEMPAVLIALAATFLYMALDANVNHSETVAWDYNGSTIARVYNGHLGELKWIESEKETSYCAILRKLFSNCVASTPGSSVSTKKKTDYQNLPDSFSD